MLKVEHLTKKNRKRLVLNDISLTCELGEIIGLFENDKNSAKEILDCLSGLSPYTEGNILWDNESMEKQRKHFVYVREHIQLLPSFNAISYGKFLKDVNPFFDMDTYLVLLQRFHVPEKTNLRVLSEDMQRLCEIAVAFSQQALLYFIVEPFLYLDTTQKELVYEELRARQQGCVWIIASQQVSEWKEKVTHSIYLQEGSIVGEHEVNIGIQEWETKEDIVLPSSPDKKSTFQATSFFAESGDDDETDETY